MLVELQSHQTHCFDIRTIQVQMIHISSGMRDCRYFRRYRDRDHLQDRAKSISNFHDVMSIAEKKSAT